jgi:hypothetical protein
MPKSYTEELSEWVKKREASRPRQDKSVVAFLTMRADVKAAIEAGYALKTIWWHLHETGKIPYRYETFLKHVRRHITHAAAEQVKGSKPEPKAGAMKPKGSPEPKKNEPPAPVRGFTFDATPKKEDLI